ncbi:BglII/BstYI family type II restriction endonuclease [Pseudoalteromonas sp. MEBiC 03485]|uniref:DUF7659 family protein n=1 Tax=Pseudoalteromonas sp. MEBiC 03485 TaxID=2571103 RepID=UPI00101EE5DC|nr:BglII/BstYI family type II restriction endonuclease [Pseudoalteromonas sp. MEBiC 03485]RZD19758.1 hypothetical protein EVU92_21380 [Pseudoalteromonas sp. MEBiC 03485]
MSLSTITEPMQTALFERLGAFFAFGKEQFNQKRKEGVEYVLIKGMGLICPKEHAEELGKGLADITKQGIALDLEQNGKDKIIERELWNYECFYQCDISDCVDALTSYPITREEIQTVFDRIFPTVDM